MYYLKISGSSVHREGPSASPKASLLLVALLWLALSLARTAE